MIFWAMKEFSIPSISVFKKTWTRAQLYLASDADFWNASKEEKDYAKFTRATDWSKVRAEDAFALLGLNLD